jgi:hypothetical protein
VNRGRETRPEGHWPGSNSSIRSATSLPVEAAGGVAASPLAWQRAALRSGLLDAPEVAVVAALVIIAPGRAGDFYGSVPSLMALSGLGERSVRAALTSLRRHGLLLQVKRGGWRNDRAEASTWRLTIPEPAIDAGSGGSDVAPEPAPYPDSGPADDRAELVPNLHESGSEPAPDAGPRAEFYQEHPHQPLSALRTDGPPGRSRDEQLAELERLMAQGAMN